MPITNLDATIQKIVSAAAAQIAHAVRLNIAEEIAGNTAVASAPAPKRGPGRPRKIAAPAAAPAGKDGAGSKRRGKRRRRDSAAVAADDARILEFVKSHAGSGLGQIENALKLPKLALTSGLLRLREARKVKTKRQPRGMTYSAA